MKIQEKQKIAKDWFIELQKIICKSIESLEIQYGSDAKFKKKKWKFGELKTIKGKVIEKGSAESVFNKPINSYTSTLISSII